MRNTKKNDDGHIIRERQHNFIVLRRFALPELAQDKEQGGKQVADDVQRRVETVDAETKERITIVHYGDRDGQKRRGDLDPEDVEPLDVHLKGITEGRPERGHRNGHGKDDACHDHAENGRMPAEKDGKEHDADKIMHIRAEMQSESLRERAEQKIDQ